MLHRTNVAHRVGDRKLWFDAATERFDHEEANALLSKRYRTGDLVADKV